MGLFVRSQIGRLRKSLIAVWIVAHVGFLSSVGSKVRPQVEIEREPLVAESALEWLLASVHELVALELGIVKELLVAAVYGADVLALSVGHQVLAEA